MSRKSRLTLDCVQAARFEFVDQRLLGYHVAAGEQFAYRVAASLLIGDEGHVGFLATHKYAHKCN
jgi:hypothetical protein